MRAIDADAIEYTHAVARNLFDGHNWNELVVTKDEIEDMPTIQPNKDNVSNLLYHIYSIESPHLDMNGVIAKKYYCEELWKELFGKESELPGWMT